MGSLLSMLGAGGAMLTLPILVYLFKIPGDVAVGGYFYLAAYSPAALSLTNHPAVGAAKVANCRGSESTVDLTLNATQLGWISFGGAAKGLARLGCNSGVRACVENAPVAVKPMTWGGIKALFAK